MAIGGKENGFVVVGASGLVGTAVMSKLGGRATGTFNARPRRGLVKLDITDAREVSAFMADLKPTVVIHTAGEANVDRCQLDPELSYRVNVEGTANVARAVAAVGARYLFFSTDYVFGGHGGPHGPCDPFEPLNTYGEHKLKAEGLVSAAVEDHLIIRACNLYGYDPGGKNFVLAVFERLCKGEPVQAPVDQWASPTLAADIGEATALAADSRLRGVAHFAGPDHLDRAELARRAACAFGFDPAVVVAVSTQSLGQAAPRPLSAGLRAEQTEAALGLAFAGVERGLGRMRRDLENAGLLKKP